MARSSRDERDQALADLSEERDRLADALRRFLPDPAIEALLDEIEGDDEDDDLDDDAIRAGAGARSGGAPGDLPTTPALQATWAGGNVVLWAGNRGVAPAERDELDRLIGEAGAEAVGWADHKGVPLPSGPRAAAVEAPIAGALGWLVGVGAGQLAGDAAPSVRWLGEVATWATELVAQGRMVPSLHRAGAGRDGKHKPGTKPKQTSTYAVQWVPAVVDRRRLRDLASRLPGPVRALDPSARPERLCRSVLAAAVDVVCRTGAGRLVTAATAPVARNRRDLSEAVLGGLDGTPFAATPGPASQMADELQRWAAPVLAEADIRLSVHLDPPDVDGGWLLSIAALTGSERQPQPVRQALEAAKGANAQQIEGELSRLGRLVPALSRTSRRGQVVLGADEAWDLMTRTGRVLVAAGFDVRVPATSSSRPSPRLRLEADADRGPSRVGPQQLSKVRWSVLFDDVELDATAIARLSAQARPLVQAKGRWVELDRADLDAAAQALAERAATTELSGAAILRHAVGLEEGSLAGPAVVDGGGWAVDLVRAATTDPPAPQAAPEGFAGELRSYQAEARGWLAFLDRVGLGGCLAMDMGLGKTPTVLAHLLATRDDAEATDEAGETGATVGAASDDAGGPALVVAPPAVLGNWGAEAARFAPDLRVHVHHGQGRATADELPEIADGADLVLTTYATAVRDVEALERISWHRVILDEAQAIKNPASEAARELRRIPTRSRLALTGTPVENGLGDLWSILDFTNPGLVGPRAAFVAQLSKPTSRDNRDASGTDGSSSNSSGNGTAATATAARPVSPGEAALRALNGLLVFRRTKAEPEIAAELPDKIDELDHCGMTSEQIGLYQAVLDDLLAKGVPGPGDAEAEAEAEDRGARTHHVLAAITALKQICDHPAAYLDDDTGPLEGRSGKLARLEELVDTVFAAGERMLVFTHFARWGERLAEHLTARTGRTIACYHGGLSRGVRDRMVREFQEGSGPGALVLSIKAGGSGLNLTAANHVVLYDRWWNPAVEDQARDRAWRIGQANTVISHRLVCPGTVDEQVEEVVAGKRRIADLVLPASSSVGDLSSEQLRTVLGLRPDALLDEIPQHDAADLDHVETDVETAA